MGRPRGSKNADTETTFFDVFSSWSKADREAALRVMNALHRHLPDKPGDPPDSKQEEFPGPLVSFGVPK